MAFEGYIAVKGAKQGQFKGESTIAKQDDLIPILDFQNQVTLPIDQATGAAGGKRQHTPVVVTKELGAASPEFYQAFVNGEVLTAVSITFNRKMPDGIDGPYFTILLTNAAVVEIRQYVGSAPGLTDNAHALENISLIYHKIEISETAAKTSASDSW
jgi:type VI secretion system secreted protein Hcp